MSSFDLESSLERAAARLDSNGPTHESARKPRSDRGRPRLDAVVLAGLEELIQGRDRPSVRTVLERLGEHCAARGLRPPARATIYQAIEQIPARSFAIGELPDAVRRTLYNLSGDGTVPGRQLAFYCLNYGALPAISFAAGLPWLALHQASRMPGWRARSRGLLDAIRRVRGI